MSNLEKLERAGLIKKGVKFSDHEKHLLESLSENEVEALISVKRKVGDAFLNKYTSGPDPTVGIVF